MNIIYCIRDGEEFLYFNNMPVFPIKHSSEYQFIKKVVANLGGRIQIVDKQDTTTNNITNKKQIGFLRPEATSNSNLLAHLTGRIAVPLSKSNKKHLEIIIAPWTDITIEFLEKHYLYGNKIKAPGIIAYDNITDLKEQILKIAVYKCVESKQKVNYSLLLNSTFENSLTESHVLELKKNISNKKNDILLLQIHSDGIDGKMENLILCPFKGGNVFVETTKSPSCLINNYCHRLKIPMTEALLSEKLLNPLNIKARILVLNSCYGILAESPIFDIRNSLAASISKNPYIGTFMANWGVILISKSLTNHLINEMKANTSVGKIIANYNYSKKTQDYGAPFAIFGDPNTNINSIFKQNPILKYNKINENAIQNRLKEFFYIRCYFLLIRNKSNPEIKKVVNEFLNKATEYELLLSQGIINSRIEELLRINFIELISLVGPAPIYDISRFVKRIKTCRNNRFCFNCGKKSATTYYYMRFPEIGDRYTLNCPTCGIVIDSSLKFVEPIFRVKRKKIFIEELPILDELSSAAIMLHYPNKVNNKFFYLPKNKKLKRKNLRISLNEHDQKGKVEVSLIYIRGWKYAISKIPCRIESN